MPIANNQYTVSVRGELTTGWWTAAGAMTAITVTTVVGNLSVVAMLRSARRTPTHYPLASLAAADFLVGAFVLPLAAARELFVFQVDQTLCAFWSALDVLCCTASILSLCALGWERWSGITSPLARARRAGRAKLLAALVWPVAVAVALPAAFVPSPVSHHEGEHVKACTVNTNPAYVFVSVVFSFYIPTTFMLVMYAGILKALSSRPPIRAHRGRGNEQVPPPSSPSGTKGTAQNTIILTPKSNRNMTSAESPAPQVISRATCPSSGDFVSRQRRATHTIIMLMSVFLLCWTPFFIMLPLDSLCECVRDPAWLSCTWLGYANSALDPLVYASASTRVRRALRASLTWTSSLKTSDLHLPAIPLPRRT